MEEQKVNMYMASLMGYFKERDAILIREKLLEVDDSKYGMLSVVDLKNPTTVFVGSLLAGCFGVDRFMIGDVGLGVLKLLTFGLCGVLTIIDWCSIIGSTQKKNFKKIMKMLSL